MPEVLFGRARDEQRTRQIEKFADVVYYNMGLACYRVNDIDMQKQGVDLIMKRPNSINDMDIMRVDEKAAVSYMHKDIGTYAFELSSESNKDSTGWFVSPSSITTHYALMWPRSDNDGLTVNKALVVIVPKTAINQWMNEHHLNPRELVSQVQALPNMYDYDGNIRSKRLHVNGVDIVQSMSCMEQPVNILIPKEDLIKMADLVYTQHSPVFVDLAHDCLQQRKEGRSFSQYLSPSQYEQIFTNVNSSRFHVYRDGMAIETSDFKHGDELCVQDKNKTICLAVYNSLENRGGWLITSLKDQLLPNIDTIQHYFTDKLQNGKVPEGFVASTKDFSQLIPDGRLSCPQHGDCITHFGKYTQGNVIQMRYNANIKAYVLTDNPYIKADSIKSFRDIPVISERELDLKRAVGDRVLGLVKAIRLDETLREEHLQKKLPFMVKDITKDLISSRCTAEELELRKATSQERAKLFSMFTHPKFVNDFIGELMVMTKEERSNPERIAAVLYDEKRNERYRADVVPCTNLNTVAYKIGVDTHYHRDRYGNESQRVSWNTESFKEVQKALADYYQPEHLPVIGGKTPAWVTAAICNSMDRPVYVKINAYQTAPVTNIPTGDVKESQGIHFDAQRGNNAVIVNWSMEPGATFTPQQLRHLQIPEVGSNENVIINGSGPSYITASMAKTYSHTNDKVYCENQAFRGYMCVASQNKNNLGQYINQTELKYQMDMAPARHQERTIEHSFNRTREDPERELALV